MVGKSAQGIPAKAKKYVFLWLLLFLAPFALMTDFFPVMRVAMFAEPPRDMNACVYELQSQNGEVWSKRSPSEFGLRESTIQQLAADHVSKGKSAGFVLSLAQSGKVLRLVKIEISENQMDTVVICQ